MKETFISHNSIQTQKLGEMLAEEMRDGTILCLSGELGSGKTTFAQGVLRGLGAKGPFTSPTFVVMKHYKIEFSIFPPKARLAKGGNFQFSNNSKISKSKNQKKYTIPNTQYQIQNIYHIDAYRVSARDILDLGWEEIVADKNNIVIIEWAERIESIIPRDALWLKFRHRKEDEREIVAK